MQRWKAPTLCLYIAHDKNKIYYESHPSRKWREVPGSHKARGSTRVSSGSADTGRALSSPRHRPGLMVRRVRQQNGLETFEDVDCLNKLFFLEYYNLFFSWHRGQTSSGMIMINVAYGHVLNSRRVTGVPPFKNDYVERDS